MVIAIIILFFAGVIITDYRALLRSKKDKAFYINTVCIILSFVLTMLHELNVSIPSPIAPVTYLIRDVWKLK